MIAGHRETRKVVGRFEERRGRAASAAPRRRGGLLAAAVLAAVLVFPPAVARADQARAVISWTTSGTDIDMHVWDADGNHAWYQSQGGVPEAQLSEDITYGPGQETFTDLQSPSTRRFTVGICYFAANAAVVPTQVSVTLTDPDGTTHSFSPTLATPGDHQIIGTTPPGPAYPMSDDWCQGSTSTPPPANTKAPAISGVSTLGAQLTCSTGDWTGSPTSYAVQWLRDGQALDGATDASYTVTAADVGHDLSCRVTASNVTGSATADSGAAAFGDSDGDGLRDDWEIRGLGPGAELNLMGASPLRRDIFVELDYMVGHRLSERAVRLVQGAFLTAPTVNLDGSAGISLHVDHGASSMMDPRTGARWGGLSRSDIIPSRARLEIVNSDWGALDDLKPSHFLLSRRRAFHYGVSIDSYDKDSSGISRGGYPDGGPDLVISLGKPLPESARTDRRESGTFMHELGHNLGLGHGGRGGEADMNFKPNYLSVMNYSFQMTGVVGLVQPLDYSRFVLPSLDENRLSEPRGLGAVPGLYQGVLTAWYCKGIKGPFWQRATSAIDWNCDNRIRRGTTVSADINSGGKDPEDDTGKGLSELQSSDDWNNLTYTGLGGINASGAAIRAVRTVPEASEEVLLRPLRALRHDFAAPRLKFVRTGRVLRVLASDAKGLDVVSASTGGRSRVRLARGRRNVSIAFRLSKGRNRVTAVAVDQALNRARRSLSVRVR